MLQLNPSDPLDLTFALKKAVKLSGLSLTEIAAQLKHEYGVEVTPSGLSHSINRGAIRLQRDLELWLFVECVRWGLIKGPPVIDGPEVFFKPYIQNTPFGGENANSAKT